MAVVAVLYLLSDLLLAVAFDPLMNLILRRNRDNPRFQAVREQFKQSIHRITAPYGTRLGPLALIAISFGLDPMTGRLAARAHGHGFLSGWSIAIAGDMVYFAVLMAATLWLNDWLGSVQWTIGIILALMLGLPALIRYRRERRGL